MLKEFVVRSHSTAVPGKLKSERTLSTFCSLLLIRKRGPILWRMNRVTSRGTPQVRVKLAVFCSLTVTSLLFKVSASEQASTLRSSCPVSNGEPKLKVYSPIPENFFKENGDSSAMESFVQDQEQSWLGVWQNLSHRVFQLADEKRTWPKLEFGWRTGTALVLGGIGSALSSAGGIGGGGLFVPLFNLLLQFDAKTSAALSNFMILGGSLANLYINLRQHHPTIHQKPLIDFDVVLLLQPNMLLGISTGVILNVVLPDWIITALLTLTLGYMTIYSYNGALCRWKKETKQNCLLDKPADGDDVQDLPEDCSTTGDIVSQTARSSSIVTTDKGDEENPKTSIIDCYAVEEALLEPLLPVDERCKNSFYPIDKLLSLAVTWIAFFAVQVLRGGKGSQSILGIAACGRLYWLLTLTQIPLALCLSVWTINRLHAAHPSKEDPEAVQEDGFVLKPKACTLFTWMALLAGLLGGLLGIGGGMIINPMFLAVGMMPQVTAGTCASMVFFSSSMSVVQFWLMGRVPVGYALTVALLCFLFSSVGVTLVHRVIVKYNRASLIVFSVATVMGVSAALMAGFGGLSVWRKYESGAYMGFHYPC